MVESFPYGKAPFWLTLSALASLLLLLWVRLGRAEKRPDLVLSLSAPNHVAAYRAVEEKFEREHGIDVALQLVHQRGRAGASAVCAGAALGALAERSGVGATCTMSKACGYFSRAGPTPSCAGR
jgi:hypothetical protein